MGKQKNPKDFIADRDIAIVGMSCLFPGARNLDEFWGNVVGKKDCITDIPETHWKVEDYFDTNLKTPDKTYCKRGGFLPFVEFDPMKYGIGPKDIDVIDTAQLLGMKVAREALKDAGYLEEEGGRAFDRDRCSAIVGTTCITELATPLNMRLSYPVIDKVLDRHGIQGDLRKSIVDQYRDSFPMWQENSFPGVLGNVVSGRIASHLNLGGTNCVIDAACASSLGAIKMAIDGLLTGTTDMAITGGVDTENNIFMYMCFSKTPAFSKEGLSRPFDKDSDGILIAEGIGLMVLKRYQDALRDNDKVYAVVRSMGSSSDGKGKSIYQPVSEGQAKAVRQAYNLGNVTPRDIDLIEAHGTGTPVGDVKEITGLRTVFEDASGDKNWCAIGSVKSQIGHTKASAGVAGMMKAALALYHRTLPPTINVEEPNPAMDIKNSSFYINNNVRPWLKKNSEHVRRAGSSAFGFGGTNFHVLLEEHDGETQARLPRGEEVFLFQGKDVQELVKNLGEEHARVSEVECIHKYARFLQHGFKASHMTATIVASSVDDLEKKMKQLLEHIQSKPDLTLSTKNGIFYLPGDEFKDAKLAVLFPGQGSQYLHQFNEQQVSFSILQETLQEVEDWRRTHDKESLQEFLYPTNCFTEEEVQGRKDELLRTDRAQTALAYGNLAQYRLLKELGVEFEAVGGHSYGELTALHAAGVLDFDQYMTLTCARGELMQKCAQEASGSMIAVLGDLKNLEIDIEKLKSEKQIEVHAANFNSSKQVVLTGSSDQVDQTSKELSASGYRVIPLRVGAAFHSPLMEDAVREFEKVCDSQDFSKPKLEVYSNTTSSVYPTKKQEVSKLFSNQLRHPVHFEKMVSNMAQSGHRIFLEAGPSQVLSRLVGQILADTPHVCLSMDGGEIECDENLKRPFEQINRLIAQLLAMGKINFNPAALGEKVENFPKKIKLSPVTVQLNGSNYLRDEMRQVPYRDSSKKVMNESDVRAAGDAARVETSAQFQKQLDLANHKIQQQELQINEQSRALLAAKDLQKQSASVVSPPASSAPSSPDGRSVAKNSRSSREQGRTRAKASRVNRPVARAVSRGRQIMADQKKQHPGTIHEFQEYRHRMLDVHEQFLQLQMEANRVYERMMFDDVEFDYELPNNQPPARGLAAQAPAGLAQPVASYAPPVVPQAPVPAPAIQAALVPPVPTHPAPPVVNKAATPTPPRVPTPPVSSPSLPQVASHTEKNSMLSSMFEKAQPVAAPKPVSAPAPTSSAPAANNAIGEFLLDTIADKTGFPREMLESNMDLENDLAVDSIRRVEILGAIQEEFPSAPVIGPSQMGVLKTIGDITGFLSGSDSQQAAVSTLAPVATRPAPEASGSSKSALADFLMEVVADKTGFPMEMLTMDMDMENDLAVDSIRRVEILGAVQEKFPDAPQIGPSQMGVLNTLGDIVSYLGGSESSTSAPQAAASSSNEIPSGTTATGREMLGALFDVISEKTGFPLEMLTPEMDLESDLAVDSIRRVEILGAIQEKFPQAPTIGPSQMGVLRTIQDLAAFLSDGLDSIVEGLEKKNTQPV